MYRDNYLLCTQLWKACVSRPRDMYTRETIPTKIINSTNIFIYWYAYTYTTYVRIWWLQTVSPSYRLTFESVSPWMANREARLSRFRSHRVCTQNVCIFAVIFDRRHIRGKSDERNGEKTIIREWYSIPYVRIYIYMYFEKFFSKSIGFRGKVFDHNGI